MAPLPTITNVVRVDFPWNTGAGVAPHNTIHLITGEDDLDQIGADLGAAFDAATNNPWAFLYSGYSLDNVLLTPLNGTSAGQVVELGTTIEGSGSGGLIPASAAVLSFRTTQRGPRGRGRIYLGPIGEASQADGIVASNTRTETIAAWNEVKASLAASTSLADLAVASYVHSEAGVVTSISMRTQAGTLRRRQNQLV